MIHFVPMLSDTVTNLSSYTVWIHSNFCFVNTETLFMITRHLDNTCSSRTAYKQTKFSVHRPYTAPHRLISQHPFATPPPSKTSSSSSCTLNTLHPHLIPHYATTNTISRSPPPDIIAHTARTTPHSREPTPPKPHHQYI